MQRQVLNIVRRKFEFVVQMIDNYTYILLGVQNR